MTYVYERMPADLHDFGWYMTDWEVELYDAILASLLPDCLEWRDDDLLLESDDEDEASAEFCDAPDELRDFILHDTINEAAEAFCALYGRDALIEAAAKYDVSLPEPGEPMYYEDSQSGDDIRDVNGERVQRLSDITDQQSVIVETQHDASQEDPADDESWYKLTQAPSTTYSELRQREQNGESDGAVADLVLRGGVEDAEDDEILVYKGTVAGVTREEPCTVYIPTFWW